MAAIGPSLALSSGVNIAVHFAEPVQAPAAVTAPASGAAGEISFEQTLAASGQPAGAGAPMSQVGSNRGGQPAAAGGAAAGEKAEKVKDGRPEKKQKDDEPKAQVADAASAGLLAQNVPVAVPVALLIGLPASGSNPDGLQAVNQAKALQIAAVPATSDMGMVGSSAIGPAAGAMTGVMNSSPQPIAGAAGHAFVPDAALSTKSAATGGVAAEAKPGLRDAAPAGAAGSAGNASIVPLALHPAVGSGGAIDLKGAEQTQAADGKPAPTVTLPDAPAVVLAAPAAPSGAAATGVTAPSAISGIAGETSTQNGGSQAQGGKGEGKQGGGDTATPVAVGSDGRMPTVTNAGVQTPDFAANHAAPALQDAKTGAPAPAAIAQPGRDAVLPGAMNSARVLQTMSGTEMRVGMHSAEFGSISIATTVSQTGIAAQIALDHAGLGAALAAHLPSMEEKLGSALGLSARVEVRETNAASSQAGSGTGSGGSFSGPGGGSAQNAPGHSGSGGPIRVQPGGERGYAAAPEQAAWIPGTIAQGRLSVQA